MTSNLLIHNARNKQWLHTQSGKIVALGNGQSPEIADCEVIDAQGFHLLAGFIDVHVHGAVGFDTMDATPESLQAMAQFYARHGVTGFLATTWTDSRERILNTLTNIKSCLGTMPNGARLLGAHLEGPYLNPAKIGAQNPEFTRRADQTESHEFLDTDVIRIVSLAPEYAENNWLISTAVARGIAVSVAHTNATYRQMQKALKLGLSHATHTFNAMTGLHHRDPGVVGAILNTPQITAELIADGIHVHPAAMNILWQNKQPDRLVLISDAIRATGLAEGTYRLDETRPIEVKTGAVRLKDGTLAGSILTMDVAVRNFMKATGEPLANIWQTASLNPAKVIGIDTHKGSLEIGKDADFILVNDKIQVQLTVVEGQIVYRRTS